MNRLLVKDFQKIKKIDYIFTGKSYIVWVEKITNQDGLGYQNQIKSLNLQTDEVSHLLVDGVLPKLTSNDRDLYYISKKDKKSEIHKSSMSGSESKLISDPNHKVINYWISPNSKIIAYLTKIPRVKTNETENSYEDPRVITELVYRTGTDYIVEQTTQQLFMINLENHQIGRISDINKHYFEANWLDSENIITYYHQLNQPKISDYKPLIKINVNSAKTEVITNLYNPYYFLNPIIFVNRQNLNEIGIQIFEDHYPLAMRAQIIKMGILSEGSIQLINKQFDRSVIQIDWTGENEALVLVVRNGYQEIMNYNRIKNEFKQLYTPDFSIDLFSANQENVYCITTSPEHPSAIHKYQNGNLTLIYDPNEEFLSDKLICIPEVLWFENHEGMRYQGWFFESGETEGPQPTILSIHGGPHIQWNNAGSMWFEWQTQVAAGYSVLALNPVGSDGYGEEFLRVIAGQWGKKDARDLLEALNQLIETKKIDKDQIFVCGGSYAGFQTVNLLTLDTRFKAACSQRGVYNLLTLDAGSDIARFDELEYLGITPEKMVQLLWNDSPISRVDKISTPLLLIHSEQDFRVPISQADHLFAEMRRGSKIVEFIRYPREGHELSRNGEPKHIMDRLERIINWFNKYKA